MRYVIGFFVICIAGAVVEEKIGSTAMGYILATIVIGGIAYFVGVPAYALVIQPMIDKSRRETEQLARERAVYEKQARETRRQEEEAKARDEQVMREARIDYPPSLRTEHTLILAPSGQGKSQLIECLFGFDLVSTPRPAIVIIDSKNDLVPRLSRIRDFYIRVDEENIHAPEGGRVLTKLATFEEIDLVVIDPKDKPALNLFDVPAELVDTRFNEVASSMRYLFESVLKTPLTGQMDVVFTAVLQVVLRIKGATLDDFVDVVNNPLNPKYKPIIDTLHSGARKFLLEDYPPKKGSDWFQGTRQGIITRMAQLSVQGDLYAMFSAPRNSVNLQRVFENGGVVLISTDADYLQDLSPIFGKFWISQVMNAALKPRTNNRPVYLYLDECAPYVDDKLETMFRFVRSYGLGITAAFQNVGFMGKYADTILTNTAIKFTAGLRPDDHKFMAPHMWCENPDELRVGKQGDLGYYRLYYDGLQGVRKFSLEFGLMEDYFVSRQLYEEFRERNRKRLSAVSVEPPKSTADDLDTHLAVVGRLYKQLECYDFDTLPLPEEDIGRLHGLRDARNKLIHEHKLVSNLSLWQQWAEHYIQLIPTVVTKEEDLWSNER